MSKAFTKEDNDDGDQDEGRPDTKSELGLNQKNYITPKGFEALRAELKQLLYTERPEVVRTVSWAASNGDRSENGDYIYGKRRLREIDRRVRFLTKRIETAEVVDPTQQKSTQVLFGATVKVKDEEGKIRTYQIVGVDETDVQNGKISWISPLAKALFNGKVGDVVTLRTPRGPEDGEEIEILEIFFR